MNDQPLTDALGFVGLGVMGAHMCRNLAKKTQAEVHVFDKYGEAVRPFSDGGFHVCASLADLAERSRIVFLSLPDSGTVRDVCLGEDGLCSGKALPEIVVDMSTTDVDTTYEIGKALAAKGVAYVDAPVARMPEAARDGTLLIMVGSDEKSFDRLLPYLGAMGSDVVRCGELGAGQKVKIINNLVLISNVNVLAEALLIGERSGVDGERLFSTLLLGSGASEALKFAGIRGLAPRNFPTGRFSARYAMKDISLAKKLGRAAGVRADILDTVEDRLRRAIEHGRGDLYYPVIIEEVGIDGMSEGDNE